MQFDYNQFRAESGGQPIGHGWYELPLTMEQKDIQEIKTNKRALYNRRYQLLNSVSAKIAESVKNLLSN